MQGKLQAPKAKPREWKLGKQASFRKQVQNCVTRSQRVF